ncbi:hypothetical protein WN943_029055 [Citrus x changshan-huyou]
MSRPHPPPEGNRESVHEVASLPYPLVGSALVGAYILVAYHGRFLPQFPPLLTVACGHRQWWEWREAPLRGAKLAARRGEGKHSGGVAQWGGDGAGCHAMIEDYMVVECRASAREKRRQWCCGMG